MYTDVLSSTLLSRWSPTFVIPLPGAVELGSKGFILYGHGVARAANIASQVCCLTSYGRSFTFHPTFCALLLPTLYGGIGFYRCVSSFGFGSNATARTLTPFWIVYRVSLPISFGVYLTQDEGRQQQVPFRAPHPSAVSQRPGTLCGLSFVARVVRKMSRRLIPEIKSIISYKYSGSSDAQETIV